MSRVLLSLFIAAYLLIGCSRHSTSRPTYIHVDSFQFVNSSLAGTLVSRTITNVRVYYNDRSLGIFDLPANIPVVADGNGVLTLSPGIAESGLNGALTVYPFFIPDTFSFTAHPGNIISHAASTGYYPGVKPTVVADFEGNSGFIRYAGDKDLLTIKDVGKVFSGGGSGSIIISSGLDSCIARTSGAFSITATNSPLFLEFTYRSSIPFSIGFQGVINGVPVTQPTYTVGVGPSDIWRKFYVNMADLNMKNPAGFYLFIRAACDDGHTTGEALIDDIRLVSF